MAVDHTAVYVPNDRYQEILQVYLAALKPLGYEIKQQYGPTVTGLGPASDPEVPNPKAADFWINGVDEAPNVKFHIALRVKGMFWLHGYS